MRTNEENKFKTVTNINTGETTDSDLVNAQESGLITSLLTKNDIVVDIGANTGYFTVLFSYLAKHVYAFEPEPNNFRKLQQNTKNLENLTLYDIAVSNAIGYATLHTCPTDNGMNRLYDSKWCEGGEKITVMTANLDNMLLHRNINFVKMDVEGSEYKVLDGMREILKRDHPTILIEFHPPSIEEAGDNPKDIYDLLKHEFRYNDPILIVNNSTIESYDQLFNNTNNCPALNILWKYTK